MPAPSSRACARRQPGLAEGRALRGVRLRQPRLGATYQAIPRQVDELLADKGAERIYARGEGDAKDDLDGDFQAWNEPLLPALADKLGVRLEADDAAAHEPLYQVQAVDKPPANLLIGGAGALPMRVLANRELQNAATSGRSTRHLEVRCPTASLPRRRPLSIVPRNRAALVERAIRRFGFSPGAHVMLRRPKARPPRCRGKPVAVIACSRTSSNCSFRRRASRSSPLAEDTRCPSPGPRAGALLDEEHFRAESWTGAVGARTAGAVSVLRARFAPSSTCCR